MYNLLSKLVNIPSVTGSEQEIGRFLVEECRRLGYDVKTQSVTRDRFNVVATTHASPTVLFNTHMDTVPDFIPFSHKGNTFYGRGACDAKGQIVAMLAAGEQLKADGFFNFGFLFVVGEEVVSDGAKMANSLALDSKFVIVGEPTGNKMAIGQKGVLVYNVRARGTGGHSSQPEKGVSAIHDLVSFLSPWIEKDWGADPVLGKNLINVGLLNGGSGINVLAEQAQARGLFRVATSLDALRRQIFSNCPAHIVIEEESASPPQTFLTLPGYETFVAGFGTDAAYLRDLGQVVLCGPGSIQFAHRQDEQIQLSDLEKAVYQYQDIAKKIVMHG